MNQITKAKILEENSKHEVIKEIKPLAKIKHPALIEQKDIRTIRRKNNIALIQMAELLGIDYGNYSRMELGQRFFPVEKYKKFKQLIKKNERIIKSPSKTK